MKQDELKLPERKICRELYWVNPPFFWNSGDLFLEPAWSYLLLPWSQVLKGFQTWARSWQLCLNYCRIQTLQTSLERSIFPLKVQHLGVGFLFVFGKTVNLSNLLYTLSVDLIHLRGCFMQPSLQNSNVLQNRRLTPVSNLSSLLLVIFSYGWKRKCCLLDGRNTLFIILPVCFPITSGWLSLQENTLSSSWILHNITDWIFCNIFHEE